MGKLRWLLSSSIFATFMYMLYMLNRLDTSVSSLINERRIMPYDVAESKNQHGVQSSDQIQGNIEQAVKDIQLTVTNNVATEQYNFTSSGVQKINDHQDPFTKVSKLAANKTMPEVVKNRTIPPPLSSFVTAGQNFMASVDQVTNFPAQKMSTSSTSVNTFQSNSTLKPNQHLKPTTQKFITNFTLIHKNGAEHQLSLGLNSSMNYTVDTQGCKIPLLNPFDPSMIDLLVRLPPLDCRGKRPPLLYAKHNRIYINVSAVRYYGNVSCHYYPIYRRDDNRGVLANASFPINEETVVDSEFVKAICHQVNISGNHVVYTDYFPFIVKKTHVENRRNATRVVSLSEHSEQLSVILLGLDSTSRNQFVRHFPKTLAYLLKDVTTIDLQGYNKVGSNTYPNMMPLLTGHLVTELPNIELVYADELPLVWKNYTRFGYRTQYGEDVPSVTLFNYGKKGFNDTPADYYLRPYSKMVEGTPFDMTKWGCLGSRLETSVILKWTEDFFDTFTRDPLFSFIFFTRLSHENFTTLSYSDAPVLEFLQHMQVKGHLNRSLVFIFGDHGFRFGTVRNRYVGRLEEKLPAMFIIIPDWFPHKFPQLYKNLKSNEHKLTTPFDIYETLNNLMYFNGKEKKFDPKSRGISLMSSIPSSRTCADAAIDAQWCSCTDWKSVDVKSKRVIQSVAVLIERINRITMSKRSVCAEVTLDTVMDAHFDRVSMGEEWSKDNSSHYQIIFRVKPSGGVFEGTAWHDDTLRTISVDGIVDRLSLYGNQSACVHDASLKPYCYCF